MSKVKDENKSLATVAAEEAEQSVKKFEVLMKDTPAGKTWDAIKDREILMFSLPNQKVSQHVRPVLVDPDKLYLLLNSTAVLPSLEEAVSKSDSKRGISAYSVELADRFVIVTPIPVPLSEKFKNIK